MKRNIIIFVSVSLLLVLGFWLIRLYRSNTKLSAIHFGTLAKPAGIDQRDGGGSVLLGGKLLWLFGDTFYSPKVPAGTPAADSWRTATSSYTLKGGPFTKPQQPVDSHGNPLQLIPFTSQELSYNRSRNDASDRYVLWPTGQVSLGVNTALIYYQRFITGAPTSNSTGLAIISAGQNTANRLPNELFSGNQPQFRKPVAHGDYIYVYTTDCGRQRCKVARVPTSQATNRSAYRFWNGKSWVPDINEAQPVIDGSNYGYTVMWNSYLQKYVSIMIGDLSNQTYVSYATVAQGPWTKPKKAFKLPGRTTYVPYFHPELGDGYQVYMTYSLEGGSIDIMKLQFSK